MRSSYIGSAVAAVVALLAAALLTACGDESGADLVASAKRRLEIKDNHAAIIQLKAALQKSPQSGEARFLLGKALLRTGDAPAAIIELNKAAEAKYSEDKVKPELARAMIES